MALDPFDRYASLDPAAGPSAMPDWESMPPVLEVARSRAAVAPPGRWAGLPTDATASRRNVLAAVVAVGVVLAVGVAVYFLAIRGQQGSPATPPAPPTTVVPPTTVTTTTPEPPQGAGLSRAELLTADDLPAVAGWSTDSIGTNWATDTRSGGFEILAPCAEGLYIEGASFESSWDLDLPMAEVESITISAAAGGRVRQVVAADTTEAVGAGFDAVAAAVASCGANPDLWGDFAGSVVGDPMVVPPVGEDRAGMSYQMADDEGPFLSVVVFRSGARLVVLEIWGSLMLGRDTMDDIIRAAAERLADSTGR